MQLLMHKRVSCKNVEFYQEQGFLVAPLLFRSVEIDEIRAEAVSIFRVERGSIEGLQVHTEDEPAIFIGTISVRQCN